MADRKGRHIADSVLDRPDIEVISRKENGDTVRLYDIHYVIAKGTFHIMVSARKFAAEVCDGPAIAEVSDYCDIDAIPMFKIRVYAAPRTHPDQPLSTLRFRKETMVLSRTICSKPASFATIAENLPGRFEEEIFGSFPSKIPET